MLAFTTECSVATTDGTNALQRVLEHVNYHVVTVKLLSLFLLKCYFITAVCLCTCNMCGTALHASVCTRRSEGNLWESVPPLFTAWDLGIPLLPSGLAARSKCLSPGSLLASPQFLIITGRLLFSQ